MFKKYLHTSSCLLMLIGFLSILITANYIWPVLLGMGSVLMYFFMQDKLEHVFKIKPWVFNAMAIILLMYLIYDSFFGSLDLVGNGVVFVLFLQTIKIISPKTNRDWLQIYLLSFLHVIASTVISDDITFAIPFLFYVILATWTLTLFNLKAQAQENALIKDDPRWLEKILNSNNIVTKKFLLTSAVLSLTLIFLTMLIFFSFPRVSFQQFLRRATSEQNISGFSDEVSLGAIGNIKTNEQIAFRVEFTKPLPLDFDYENLYFRGTSADHFDGYRWKQTQKEERRVSVDFDEPVYHTKPAPFPGGQLMDYKVYLESMNTMLLFGIDRLVRIEWSKTFIERILRRAFYLLYEPMYESTSFVTQQKYIADLNYHAQSIFGEPQSALLRQDRSTHYPYWVTELYMQLPRLESSVKKYFESLRIQKSNKYDQVIFVLQKLKTQFTYTLNVNDHGTTDPLKFFLIDSKKGHCEYFSTAMVMALRYLGIPAREVMGFRGGQNNPFGNYLAVKQSNAHTWVEVYFPKYGFVRFDPTPSDERQRSQSRILVSFQQFVDSLRLRWNKYIIEYDLKSQLAFLQNVYTWYSQKFHRQKAGKLERDPKNFNTKRVYILWAFVISILFFTYILYRQYVLKIKSSKNNLWHDIDRLLEKRKMKRLQHQTPMEFFKLNQSRIPNILNDIIHAYYQHRFGQTKLDLNIWQSLIHKLKISLKRKKN